MPLLGSDAGAQPARMKGHFGKRSSGALVLKLLTYAVSLCPASLCPAP